MIHHRVHDDDGAILVLAIIVITSVALVVAAVLTQGDGSLRATIALRQVAGTTYAADGAAQIAINNLRTGKVDSTSTIMGPGWAFNNTQPGPGCFGEKADNTPIHELVLPNFYPATKSSGDVPTSAAVDCRPENATGASGSPVPVSNANKPGNAILTLGTSTAEHGIDIKPQSSTLGEFRVHGGIWSNSNIVASIGDLRSSESIRARTGCTPFADMKAPIVDCYAAPVADPGIAESAKYAPEITSVPELRAVPITCGPVVTFEPGYYDNAAALNNITDKNACSGSTFWFKPGTYYFDFHNKLGDPLHDPDIAPNSSDNEWVVGVGRLVGGTPAGAITSVTDASFPGSCVNPIDNVDNGGVQFIFGGESRLKVDDGANVEICGDYKADRPPIAIYGLKGDSPAVMTSLAESNGNALRTSGTPNVTAAGTDGTFNGATEAALQSDGGGSATWFRPSGGANSVSRTITMPGFAPVSTIPAGSVLKQATLVVRHRSAQNSAGTASQIKLTPAGGSVLPMFELQQFGTLTTQTVQLSTAQPALFGALQKHVHDRGYTGATVDFTATIAKDLGATSVAELDGVRLELEYYLPQLRGQTHVALGTTNCLETLNSCAIVSTPTAYKDRLYIQGTTYAPIARIDLNLNQATAQVMRFGVIVRSLAARTTGGFAYEGPVIELPDNSPGWGFQGTLVQFEVYLCPNSPTCSVATGNLALTSRVQLWDPSGAPVPGQRQVTILSWSHRR